MPVYAAHTIDPDDGTMPLYNGMDACLTYEIRDVQRRLPSSNETLIYNFELGMQAPALEMMLRGFRVDPYERERAIGITQHKLNATTEVLNALTTAVWGKGINPNAREQLKSLFYDHIGIKRISGSFQGVYKEPMDRKTLERIEDYFYARPIVNATLLARDLIKTLQVLRTEIDQDWRWRTSYNIAGTTTGRWSSSKNAFGLGGNAQNITEELRRIFIADEGYKLCGIDLEQAEAREVGWFCGTVLGDWSYLNMIEAGDPHTYVARMCWPELPWTGDIKADRHIAQRKFYRHFTYRDATKRLSHGSNYLGTPPTMASHTKIPLNVVRLFQARYFTAFPCIPAMHHWVARELQTKQYLVNAFGRRRDFFDRPNSEENLRAAVAFMFQSATGDRLNLGLWRVWKHMGLRIQLLAQLHDALYFQYRVDDDESAVIREAQKHMEVWLRDPHTGRTFTIPSDAVAGLNWAHRYRLDEEGNRIDWNPRGLDKVTLH